MNRVVAVGGAATAAGLGAAVLWWGGQSALDRLRAQARAAARRHADRLFPPSRVHDAQGRYARTAFDALRALPAGELGRLEAVRRAEAILAAAPFNGPEGR